MKSNSCGAFAIFGKIATGLTRIGDVFSKHTYLIENVHDTACRCLLNLKFLLKLYTIDQACLFVFIAMLGADVHVVLESTQISYVYPRT